MFPLVNPQQQRVGECSGFEYGVGPALVERMAAGGAAIPVDARQRSLAPLPTYTPPSSTSLASQSLPIHEIGRELGVHYLVSGVIHDLGLQPAMVPLLSWVFTRRRFEIEVTLYDAVLGDRLFTQRYAETAGGQVRPDDSIEFGSQAFYRNAYGKAVGKVLDAASLDLLSVLACRPFLARIERVDGERAIIQAGRENRLALGASLTLYRATDNDASMPRLELSAPLGTLIVQRLGQRDAVAVTDHELTNPPRAGDIVAGW